MPYKETKELHAVCKTMNSFEKCVSDIVLPHTGRVLAAYDRDEGHYPHIPASISKFIMNIMLVDKYLTLHSKEDSSELKFLDIGCGLGTKVVLAKHWFFNAYGLELQPKYVRFAKRWMNRFGIDPERIIEGDACTFNRYHEFDILYFYHPMHKWELQQHFQEHLLATAKSGAVIIAFTAGDFAYNHLHASDLIKPLFSDNEYLWIKK